MLGLDVGGTKLAAGLVATDGTFLSFASVPTGVADGPDTVLARLFALGGRVLAQAGVNRSELAGVGVGCGGPLDPVTGTVCAPPHLPGWTKVELTAAAEREFGVPAWLHNDGTAAALGEYRFGAGRGRSHLVYLTISTGVGGGVVLDGRCYQGATGNAAELGHVTVQRGGRRCGCGRRGCLEAYVSGSAIAARAREALADGGTGMLADSDQLTAVQVVAAARAGDPLATSLWRETTELLADGLTSIVNVFEPELVVLGGGVTRSGSLLLDPVRAAVRQSAMPQAAKAEIVLSGLGDRVGVAGAAAIALEGVGR